MTVPPKPKILTPDDVVAQLRATVNPDFLDDTVTVAQLRAALADLPDDAIVVLPRGGDDPNEASPLQVDDGTGLPAVEEVLYYPKATWWGAVDSIDNEVYNGGAVWAVLLKPVA